MSQVTGTVVLAVGGGALVAAGVTLLLERSMVRLVVGLLMLGNGVNLLLLTGGGPAGGAPILTDGLYKVSRIRAMNDPLPQVMILTAIVIALASAAFLLSIAYRAARLSGDDEVRDDVEDRRVSGGDDELRARIREQRREFRHWSRARRREIRRARAELRAQIRAERERRAVADPAETDDTDDTGGADSPGGPGGTSGTGGAGR
ncbi:Na(+)/H(+) antiporter subunit C [Actinomadura hibisca]|uniref:Na(+)/H(+) antiporter subunit C n=1 Tax=Actinomadura hibisca TaxID=68565 RepID=UPI000835B4B6|nr:Na(+)/H(+) antiporter subunit C [Actinomadura hibisca]